MSIPSVSPAESTKPLRAAIIGAGAIAEVHAAGYSAAGVEVVAISDLDAALAQKRAAEWGIPHAYGDAAQLLHTHELDMVSICTPAASHHALTLLAARAGVHVLCEKPIAVDLVEAEEMIRVCEEQGVLLQIGHMLRSNPAVRTAKSLIDAGVIGAITTIRLRQAHDWGGAEQVRPTFATRASGGGGTLLDNGCHLMDLARFLVGDVEEVYARMGTLRWPIELEDSAVVTARFKSGAIGTIETSWSATGWEEGFWIHGTQGSLEWSNRHKEPELVLSTRQSGGTDWEKTDVTRYEFVAERGHNAQIASFAKAVRSGGPVACEGHDGREAVRIVLASYDSARKNRPIRLGEEATSLQEAMGDEANAVI